MKKNKLKIILPVLIVIALVGMYFVKNKDEISTSSNDNVKTTEVSSEGADSELLISSGVPDIEEFAKKDMPIIIDYGSDTCEPCRIMEPEYKSFHEKMQGKATVKYVDIDLNREAAQEAPIQVIPTQILYNADGTPFEPSKEVREKFNLQMYNHKVTKKPMFTVHQGYISEEELLELAKAMGVED